MVLTWTAPTTFADNATPLNPSTDLDDYEIFVQSDSVFADGTPFAYVHPTSPNFNLALVPAFANLPRGTYYVFMRSVSANGSVKSAPSEAASFSL